MSIENEKNDNIDFSNLSIDEINKIIDYNVSSVVDENGAENVVYEIVDLWLQLRERNKNEQVIKTAIERICDEVKKKVKVKQNRVR